MQNHLYFYVLAMNNSKKRIKKIPPMIAASRIKYLGIMSLTKKMQQC